MFSFDCPDSHRFLQPEVCSSGGVGVSFFVEHLFYIFYNKRTMKKKTNTKISNDNTPQRSKTMRRRTCTLMITYSCNLNCIYCYEQFKSNKRMSFDMAKSIVEKEIAFVRDSPDYDELEIDFMGGEPFWSFH